MYKFKKSSKERLAEVHELLQELVEKYITESAYYFGIPCTGACTAKQQRAF